MYVEIYVYNKILNCVSVVIILLFLILDDFYECIMLFKSCKIIYCIFKVSVLCLFGI